MLVRGIHYACILCTAVQGWLLCAMPAHAEGWGGSVAVATDYIYRGISQTDQRPALQAGVQFQSLSGWTAGAWGSSVDFQNGSGTAYELDLHAGYAWALSPDWSARVGYVHYGYLNDGDSGYDYDEVTLALSFQQRVTASIAWSPNTSRRTRHAYASQQQALAYELSLLQPVHPHWSLSAGVGYYDLRDLFGTGYWFWSGGVAFTWQSMQVDLLHIDADSTADYLAWQQAGGSGRWTAAFSWRF